MHTTQLAQKKSCKPQQLMLTSPRALSDMNSTQRAPHVESFRSEIPQHELPQIEWHQRIVNNRRCVSYRKRNKNPIKTSTYYQSDLRKHYKAIKQQRDSYNRINLGSWKDDLFSVQNEPEVDFLNDPTVATTTRASLLVSDSQKLVSPRVEKENSMSLSLVSQPKTAMQ